MEVTNPWSNSDINKYYIITRDKETNEWKFFREIKGHTVFWKDEPSHYGMTKSKAIEVLNIVKNLTKEDVKPKDNNETTEPTTPTDGESTEPSGENSGTTTPTDTPTEPSVGNNGTPTSTEGETSTGENKDPETPSEGNTEPTTPTEEPTEPSTPTEPTEEPQYKIITISSVTYNSEETVIFDDADYHKLKTTLIYIDTTYSNTDVHVVVAESDTGKTIFYFYLNEELTWFLELKTNIDYALVRNVTTLNDIKELL